MEAMDYGNGSGQELDVRLQHPVLPEHGVRKPGLAVPELRFRTGSEGRGQKDSAPADRDQPRSQRVQEARRKADPLPRLERRGDSGAERDQLLQERRVQNGSK